MSLTEQQTRLAAIIDTHVTHVIARDAGDEKPLVSLTDHMGTFKPLRDLSPGEDMNTRCPR